MSDQRAEADAVAEIARQAAMPSAAEISRPDSERFHLVRETSTNQESHQVVDRVRVLSMEAFAAVPYRRRGTVVFDDPGSIVGYVNEFKIDGATRIYASLAGRNATAIIDDDPAIAEDLTAAGWRGHRAELRVLATPEWARWREADNRKMTQGEFAEHLEVNLSDVAEPAAADLVEIARSLTASNDVQFRSATNLQSGEIRFAYDENVQAKATGSGGSTIDIPKTFALRIAVFQGTDPIEVTARLRYQLSHGSLFLSYLLVNADDIERRAFHEQVEAVGVGVGIVPLYGGAPPPVTPQDWRQP